MRPVLRWSDAGELCEDPSITAETICFAASVRTSFQTPLYSDLVSSAVTNNSKPSEHPYNSLDACAANTHPFSIRAGSLMYIKAVILCGYLVN